MVQNKTQKSVSRSELSKTLLTGSTDTGQLMFAPSSSRVISRPYAYDHTIYVDEILYEPADWRYELDLIRTAGPDDVFHLHINSGGGNIAVLIALITAMRASVATFIGYLNYECCSAATVLLLECDQWFITEDCCFMIHNSSTGYGGKSNNLTDYALFNDDHSRNLVIKYYKDFLTEAEMEDVLKGVELWLSGEEVVKRLNARQELKKAKEKEELTNEDEDCEEWPLDVAFEVSSAPLEELNFGASLARDAISGTYVEGTQEENTDKALDVFVTNYGPIVGKNFCLNLYEEVLQVMNPTHNSGLPVWDLELNTEAWCFEDEVSVAEVKDLCNWLGISYGSKASKKTLIAKVKSFVNNLVETYGKTEED